MQFVDTILRQHEAGTAGFLGLDIVVLERKVAGPAHSRQAFIVKELEVKSFANDR